MALEQFVHREYLHTQRIHACVWECVCVCVCVCARACVKGVYIYSACIRLHIQCVYTYTYVQIYRYVCVHSIAHRSAGILLLTAWPVTMRVYRTSLPNSRAIHTNNMYPPPHSMARHNACIPHLSRPNSRAIHTNKGPKNICTYICM